MAASLLALPRSTLPLFFVLSVVTIAAATKPNVLMIAVDDLRPVGKVLGEPEVLTPNLDRLAARAVSFAEAFVQSPTCGVSRSSLLTSRRPDTTHVLVNGGCPFTSSPDHKSWQSLPEYFKNNGYTTAGMGKIFHPDVCEGAEKGEWSKSWTLPYFHAPCIDLGSIFNGTCMENAPFALPGKHTRHLHAYANATATDEDMPDGMIAAHAVETLKNLSQSDEPFFLSVGFHKPHLPHIAPKKYFDLYEKVSLPQYILPPKDLPVEAWNPSSEFLKYPDNKQAAAQSGYSQSKPFNQSWIEWSRKAYFAAASFTDAQIGKVLATLEELGLANNTLIVLWGDHGWQLGENNEWGKHTAFVRAVRAPLLFALPSAVANSANSVNSGAVVRDSYAEFVDIMPTLADLAGLPPVPLCANATMSQKASVCTEGTSLAGVVRSPENSTAKDAAFYQWKIHKYTGYSIVTSLHGSKYRYTEWVIAKNYEPKWPSVVATEMYNRSTDPEEHVNIATSDEPATKLVAAALSKKLHAGWRKD